MHLRAGFGVEVLADLILDFVFEAGILCCLAGSQVCRTGRCKHYFDSLNRKGLSRRGFAGSDVANSLVTDNHGLPADNTDLSSLKLALQEPVHTR